MTLASFIVFTLFAGLTMFDAMLTFAVTAGVFALTCGRPRWIGLGAAIALGVFAKGPVILLHLMPLALLTPVWIGISWRRMVAGVGTALATAVAILSVWLVPALIAGGPEYREAVLWTQSAGRVVTSFAHMRPWWFYLAALPLLTWPWGWTPAFWQEVWRARGLLPIWACSALVLFSAISGKQVQYLLPVLPALALIVSSTDLRPRCAAILPLIAGLVLIAASLGLMSGDLGLLLSPAALMAPLGMVMIAFAAALARWGRGFVGGVGLIGLLNLLFLGFPGQAYDSRRIGEIIAPHDTAGIGIVSDKYAAEFSFAARLRNPVATLDLAQADGWLSASPGRALIARMDGDHPVDAPDVIRIFRDRPYGIWTR